MLTERVCLTLRDRTARLALSFVLAEAGRLVVPTLEPGVLHVADQHLDDPARPPVDVLLVRATPAPSRRAVDAFAGGRVRAVADEAAPEQLPNLLDLLERGLGTVPTRVVEAAREVPPLRPRLERTLQLVLRGEPNRRIARAVHQSEATAKRDVAELLRLFDAPNRMALCATAIRLGYEPEGIMQA